MLAAYPDFLRVRNLAQLKVDPGGWFRSRLFFESADGSRFLLWPVLLSLGFFVPSKVFWIVGGHRVGYDLHGIDFDHPWVLVGGFLDARNPKPDHD